LILLGTSVLAFFVFVVLHNAFYALTMVTSHIAALSHLMEALSAASFIIAVLLCPAIFLVGIAGSIICTIKSHHATFKA